VTTDVVNRPLSDHFSVMITAASELFGADSRSGTIVSAPIRDGVVMIGDAEVVPSSAPIEETK